MANVTILEKQLVNEYGSGYGMEVVAVVEDGDRNDGINALREEYGEETLYGHQGDVWDQFHWRVVADAAPIDSIDLNKFSGRHPEVFGRLIGKTTATRHFGGKLSHVMGKIRSDQPIDRFLTDNTISRWKRWGVRWVRAYE